MGESSNGKREPRPNPHRVEGFDMYNQAFVLIYDARGNGGGMYVQRLREITKIE